jgi:hypothetical protein
LLDNHNKDDDEDLVDNWRVNIWAFAYFGGHKNCQDWITRMGIPKPKQRWDLKNYHREDEEEGITQEMIVQKHHDDILTMLQDGDFDRHRLMYCLKGI